MLDTFTLPNGLKVATYSIPEMRSVFLSLAVKGGWMFDTPEKSGTAHLMEHLLVQGIPSLPNVEEFSNFMEKMAGSYNAITEPEAIKFIASAPSRHLKEVLKIGGEVFFEPLFLNEAIDRERNVVIAEIKQKQDSVNYKNYRFFVQNRYKEGNPMRLESGGTVKTVSGLKREDLIDYWQKFFHPNNCYLALVGGFSSQQARKLIYQFFKRFKIGESFPGFPPFTTSDMSDWKVAIRKDSSYQATYITLSFPSIAGKLPLREHLPRLIIAYILAELRGSRLNRLLRQQKGLVYDVGFGSSSYQNFGYSQVHSQMPEEKTMEVIKLTTNELANFIAKGPTREEVEFTKDYLANRIMMRFDHPGNIADWIEGDLLWEDKIYSPEEYVKMMEEVDIKTIRGFINKYWDLSKLNLTIQGPINDSEKNIKKFEKLVWDLKPGG